MLKNKRILFLYTFCIFCTSTFAQNDTIQKNIISYSEKITASISYLNNSNSFFITEDVGLKTTKIEFEPNTKQRIAFGLSYKIIDVSIGFSPKFLQQETSETDAKNFNLSFRFNYKNWYQSLNYIDQRGFFINFDDVSRIYLPRFKSRKIGGTTSYVFNDKFSYKTIFNQNQWQTKSSGSFVSNFSFYYTNLLLNEEFGKMDKSIYTLSLAPSYYYNWVISKKFLISIGLSIGAGVNIVEEKGSLVYEFSSTFKFGYNHDVYYAYLDTNGTSFLEQNKNNQFNDSFVAARLVLGYRFDPPKPVKKVYDYTLGRIGL